MKYIFVTGGVVSSLGKGLTAGSLGALLDDAALYARMAGIVAAYAPWELGAYTYENTLVRPWVRGYVKHVSWEHPWKYHDLDIEARRRAK